VKTNAAQQQDHCVFGQEGLVSQTGAVLLWEMTRVSGLGWGLPGALAWWWGVVL
jgi:hypothetical protein